MNGTDVYEIIGRYAVQRANYMLGQIKHKDESNFQIDGQNLEIIKRGVASTVSSLVFKYLDKNNNVPESDGLLLKSFGNGNHNQGHRYRDVAASTRDTSNFLSGNGDYPVFYFEDRYMPEGNNSKPVIFLGLQRIGEKTVHEIVSKGYSPEDTIQLIQAILPCMSRFQINNTTNLREKLNNGWMTPERYHNIFYKRNSTKRTLDYLRAIQGLDYIRDIDKGLRRRVLELAGPIRRVFEPRIDSFRVTHGDPIFKNIIFMGNNRYGFIDADPAIGDPLQDLGALLATPNLNLNPHDWDHLTDVFSSSDTRVMEASGIDLKPTREGLVGKLMDLGVEFSRDQDPPGNPYYLTSMILFFRASRIAAKVKDMKRNSPEKYEKMVLEDPSIETTPADMRRTMSLALGRVVKDPPRFEIQREEDVKDLFNLYGVLGNAGVVDSYETYTGNDKTAKANVNNGTANK